MRKSLKKGKLPPQLKHYLEFYREIGAEFIFQDRPPVKNQMDSVENRFLALEKEIKACQRCDLARTRTQAVPGEGNKKAELLFVGEAPGRDEDLQGRPFVGRAGALLTKIIKAMNFSREEVYITNVIKCRPPQNRTPNRKEIMSCYPYLLEQIELIKPRVIVALGGVAAKFFIPEASGIMKIRGKWHEFQGIPVMPTFHPSYLIRNERDRERKRMVWEDMQKVMELLGRK